MPGIKSIDIISENTPKLTAIPNPKIKEDKINSFIKEEPKNEIEMPDIKVTGMTKKKKLKKNLCLIFISQENK